MKKLSIASIIILFGLLFALSGCLEQAVEERVILGRDGVVISFELGMPPTSIDEYEPFDIGVLMENKGLAKVEAGDAGVFISGIVPGDYKINDVTMTYDNLEQTTVGALEGAYIEDDELIPGDSEGLYWTGLKYQVDIPSGVYPVTFTAQSCYKYSTTAWTDICLATRSALRDIAGTPICEISGAKSVTNNAAPVQVSRVTESAYGSDGFRAIIEIQNVGNGIVYDPYSIGIDTDNDDVPDAVISTSCQGLHRQYQDRVYIDEVKLGAEILEAEYCPGLQTDEATGKHFVKLTNGVKLLTCRKGGVAKAGVAESKMEIKLSYGYTETIQTSMDINAVV